VIALSQLTLWYSGAGGCDESNYFWIGQTIFEVSICSYASLPEQPLDCRHAAPVLLRQCLHGDAALEIGYQFANLSFGESVGYSPSRQLRRS